MLLCIILKFLSHLHRISTVAVMIAFKFYCETQELIPNSIFAKLIGVESAELLQMELSFFKLLDYSVFVSWQDFNKYQKDIQPYLLIQT